HRDRRSERGSDGIAAAPLALGGRVLAVSHARAARAIRGGSVGSVRARRRRRAARDRRADLSSGGGAAGADRPARPPHHRQAAIGPDRLMGKTFAELGLSESTVRAVQDRGYGAPRPLQEQPPPSLLHRRDVIAQAQTGTRKPATPGLPIM